MNSNSMPLPAFSVAAAMADQNVGLRHYASNNDARSDRMCRTRCSPANDDLAVVQASHEYYLNRILEASLQVLNHDHTKPPNMDICTDEEWQGFVGGLKDEIRSKAIDEETGMLSPQAERMGRFLLEEVFFLHQHGWHVDLWKPHIFNRMIKQYDGMTCTDRIEEICRVLSTCAPVTHNVLEGRNLEKIASAPGIMMEEKISYKKSNKRRSLTTKEAKTAKIDAHRKTLQQQSATPIATSPIALAPYNSTPSFTGNPLAPPFTADPFTPSFAANSSTPYPGNTRNKRRRLEPSTSWIPTQPVVEDRRAIGNEIPDSELPSPATFAQYDTGIPPDFEGSYTPAALRSTDFSFPMPSAQPQHDTGNISSFETSFEAAQASTENWGAASGAESSLSMPSSQPQADNAPFPDDLDDFNLGLDFGSYIG
ncbi:hypothetical protein BST61_g6676 [Cercospora zeina]